mmetsp:Transcript_89616/g.200251  ORF Transcript_89616/g.200251 Transcript_89616/m.200251 type:complete len:234 (-) Transcript_89616:673-1374(-)
MTLAIQVILRRLHLLLHGSEVLRHLHPRLLRFHAHGLLRFLIVDSIVEAPLVRLELPQHLLVLLFSELEVPGEHGMLIMSLVLFMLTRAQLILHDINFVLEACERSLRLLVVQALPDELPICLLERLIHFFVLVLHLLVEAFPILHLILLLLFPPEVRRILLAEFLQLVVSDLHAVDGLLPLLDELLPIIVQLAKKLRRLVHLDLLGLRIRDHLFELLPLRRILHSELLDGQG